MYERSLRAFARLARWQRIVIAVPITFVTLWFVSAVIIVLFAFALGIGLLVAAIADLLILFAVTRFVRRAKRYRERNPNRVPDPN
jgi:membrane protein implicated in regulation of membrane protease activity